MSQGRSKIFWPDRVAALGLAVGLFFSLVLFTNDGRTLPHCPLVNLPHSFIIERILYDLCIFSSLAIALGKFKKLSVAMTLTSLIILILFDLDRFQPWVYEYAIVLFLSALPENNKELAEEKNCKLNAVSLFLVSIYFFTGMQKLNWRFITSIGPWLLGYTNSTINTYDNYLPLMLASLTMPLGEIALAITLSFKRTRILGLVMGLIMHAIILWEVGPDRFNVNAAVWPWNITQMFLLIACFAAPSIKNRSDKILVKLHYRLQPLTTATLAIVSLIVPTLGLFRLADPFPSFAFYTGDVPSGSILFEDVTIQSLPNYLRRALTHDKETGLWALDIVDWSLIETGTSVYPSTYCLRTMAKDFAAAHPGEKIVFKLKTFPKLSKETRIRYETITASPVVPR